MLDTASWRTTLRSRIWRGGLSYPTAEFTRLATGAATPDADIAPANLLSIDRAEIDIYDGASTLKATAVVYIWHPTVATANGRLALHCTGHAGNYVSGLEVSVTALVEAGYTVAGLQCPVGSVAAHNAMPAPTAAYHALQLFCEPGVRTLNALAADYTGGPIIMTGLSGGGWTTHLLAALDQRVRRAYPVAGSMPLICPGSGRDWEQWLFDVGIDYPTLYVMACDDGRALIHFSNDYDDCCFGRGIYSGAPLASQGWERTVAAAAASLGGHYELAWTGSATHEMSDAVIAQMLADAA